MHDTHITHNYIGLQLFIDDDSFQSDNVEMVKALAALGADVNLCTTCTRNGRELSEHHLPTEIESQLDSWAVYEYVDGGKTSVHNEYSPSMRTLLEEVGAMTPHTKETHHHFLTKVPTRQRLQTRIDSEGQQKRGARVLCLDGGGARGLIQLEILRQLEEKLGGKIIDKFDYIIGSSAGGIIALALVYGKYMYVVHLYLHVYGPPYVHVQCSQTHTC